MAAKLHAAKGGPGRWSRSTHIPGRSDRSNWIKLIRYWLCVKCRMWPSPSGERRQHLDDRTFAEHYRALVRLAHRIGIDQER